MNQPACHRMATLLVVFATLSVGCGDRDAASPPAESELAPASGNDFSRQLESGRDGQTDRIALTDESVGDDQLALLNADDRWLEVLQLDRGEVSDQGIESIARLPELWHLRLRLSPITDAGLETLSRCPTLRILNLPQCAATSAGIAHLARLPRLSNLRLGGGEFGPEIATEIAKLSGLKDIHLIGIAVDDEGLREIATLPKLRSLYLDDSDVTQAGWDWLFETHPKLHVHVNQKHLDRADHHH